MKKSVGFPLIFCFILITSGIFPGCMAKREAPPPSPTPPPPPPKVEPAPLPSKPKPPDPPKTAVSSKSKQKKEVHEQIEKKLWLAKKCLGEGKYRQVPPLAEEVLAMEPSNRMAEELANAACYRMGMNFFEEQKYIEALEMFKRVKAGYKDVDERIAETRQKMEALSEKLYKLGVQYFVEEELQKAIEQWQRTLALNPDHPQAKKDIENARHLLEELEKIEE
ncbi:MAG: hypothetical protein SWH68_12285 [Thermodesulfobacteriota bacterium]|nr:hypothetical protein [Thermodesulfobacteriota bacterium]